MKFRKPDITIFCLGTLLHLPFVISAQLPVRVDGENIKKIITTIASDEYQGRETGTRGCEMAEEYFANEFKKLKLVPVGDNGTYFYQYTIPNEEFDVKPSLVIDDRSFYYGYNEDFSVAYKSDRGEAGAEIVFAGYGIFNPEKNHNDFDSIDIKNKIVLMKRGAPKNDIAGWRPSCIDSVKAEYCYKHGATGVLFFEPASRTNQQILIPGYNNHLAYVSVIPGFPVFSVDERVARYILSNSGKSYYRLIYTIDSQISSFNTGRKCSMSAKANSKPSINTRNVMAMITGSDKKLKDEYIIIGGHIDHIGVDDAGNIRNGADDNASGPAVALGIAQAMVKNKFKPKRSIVFIGWTGEEMGLLGSKAWCEKPTIDLKKIVLYFNLDMVGLGNGSLNMPGTEFAPEVYEFIKKNTDTTSLQKITWSKGGLGGSDHNYFLTHGVPAFAGMTAGSHPDYHQPADDPEKIKPEILQLTGDFIYYCSEKIANAKENFITAQRFDENKFRLVNYSILRPVYSKNFHAELENKNFKLGLVDFSDVASSSDPEENFINLLGAFNNATAEKKPTDNYTLVMTPYEAMMNRMALLAVFNPEAIHGEELKFKVLARFGYRLARIDNNSAILRDTAALRKFVRLSSETGVGLILDNLNESSLEQVLSFATDPCLVLSKDASLISDSLLSRIKEKEHLLVFQPRPENSIESDLKKFSLLMDKVGRDHIAITPEDLSDTNYIFFKGFMKLFIVMYPDQDFQYKILTGNFYNVAAKSLQVN